MGEVRKLPSDVHPVVQALWCQPKCFHAMADHLAVLKREGGAMGGFIPHERVPVIVISSGNQPPDQIAAHRMLAEQFSGRAARDCRAKRALGPVRRAGANCHVRSVNSWNEPLSRACSVEVGAGMNHATYLTHGQGSWTARPVEPSKEASYWRIHTHADAWTERPTGSPVANPLLYRRHWGGVRGRPCV